MLYIQYWWTIPLRAFLNYLSFQQGDIYMGLYSLILSDIVIYLDDHVEEIVRGVGVVYNVLNDT